MFVLNPSQARSLFLRGLTGSLTPDLKPQEPDRNCQGDEAGRHRDRERYVVLADEQPERHDQSDQMQQAEDPEESRDPGGPPAARPHYPGLGARNGQRMLSWT